MRRFNFVFPHQCKSCNQNENNKYFSLYTTMFMWIKPLISLITVILNQSLNAVGKKQVIHWINVPFSCMICFCKSNFPPNILSFNVTAKQIPLSISPHNVCVLTHTHTRTMEMKSDRIKGRLKSCWKEVGKNRGTVLHAGQRGSGEKKQKLKAQSGKNTQREPNRRFKWGFCSQPGQWTIHLIQMDFFPFFIYLCF